MVEAVPDGIYPVIWGEDAEATQEKVAPGVVVLKETAKVVSPAT